MADLLGVAIAASGLLETAIREFKRVRKAYEHEQSLTEALNKHTVELTNLLAIVHMIEDEDALQTTDLVPELAKLQAVGAKLVQHLKTLDRGGKGSVHQLAQQLVRESKDEKILADIMKELDHAKSNICLRIQLAVVGLTSKTAGTVLANADVIHRIDRLLLQVIGEGRTPQDDGLVPPSKAEGASLSEEAAGATDPKAAAGSRLDDETIHYDIMNNCVEGEAIQVLGQVGEDKGMNRRVNIQNNRLSGRAVQIVSPIDFETLKYLLDRQKSDAVGVQLDKRDSKTDKAGGTDSRSYRQRQPDSGHSRIHDEVLENLARRQVSFSADWELPKVILKGSKERTVSRELLGATLTLVGSVGNCRPYTCEEYMSQHWPEIFSYILAAVADAVKHMVEGGTSEAPSPQVWTTKSYGACEIKMLASKTEAKIQVRGSDKFVAAAVDAVAWLCAAVRVRPREGVMLSDVQLHDDGNIQLLPLKAVAASNADCWHELFKAAVITTAPSTTAHYASSREEGRGLELSFDDMAYLAGIVVRLEIGHFTVLVGHSTLLIPVKQLEAGIQWHLELWESSKSGLVSALERQKDWVILNMDDLRTEKAFLGWNSSTIPVQTLLSTDRASYSLTASAAEAKPLWFSDNTQIQGGLQGGFRVFLFIFNITQQFQRWGGERIRFNLDGDADFNHVIDRAERRTAVLYDTNENERRGWMVGRLDFLHHAVIARLRHQNNPIADPYAETTQRKREILEAEKETIVGGRPLKAFVVGLATVLNIMTETLERKRRRRGKTRGVDFRELVLADNERTIQTRKMVLAKSSGGWELIVKHSWVIFCDGFGEVIRPAGAGNCARESLPRNHCYLAAKVDCLQEIADDDWSNRENATLEGIKEKLKRSSRTLGDCGNLGCRCVVLRALNEESGDYARAQENSAVVFGWPED